MSQGRSRFRWLLILAGAVAPLGTLIAAAWADSSPIVFESAESSDSPHGAIYNRVTWSSSPAADVWVMQQSQRGWSVDHDQWDRLMIIVDKSRRPYTARFIQTEPGPLVTQGQVASREYGVPCMRCHSNGPRAIRPVTDPSTRAPVSLWSRLRLSLWNLRVASYGRIVAVETPLSSGEPRLVTLSRSAGEASLTNESSHELGSDACVACHHDGRWGRGRLTREQAPSIRFLVERGFMPPLGFGLSRSERERILRFAAE